MKKRCEHIHNFVQTQTHTHTYLYFLTHIHSRQNKKKSKNKGKKKLSPYIFFRSAYFLMQMLLLPLPPMSQLVPLSQLYYRKERRKKKLYEVKQCRRYLLFFSVPFFSSQLLPLLFFFILFALFYLFFKPFDVDILCVFRSLCSFHFYLPLSIIFLFFPFLKIDLCRCLASFEKCVLCLK